jgi:hypothetical protein
MANFMNRGKIRMTIRRAVLILAGVVAVAGIASSASATATAKVHHAGSCTARGQYATCVASGNANHPVTIEVHVRSSHRGQRVSVTWSDVCSKGTGVGMRNGSYTAKTVSTRKIKHPYKRPDSCSVVAEGQLHGGSFIKVWITYTR